MSLATITPDPPPLPARVRVLLEDRLASGSVVLPALPDAARQVMSLAEEGRCDALTLAEVLERDRSLVGHVLRVSNAAAFAPEEPIVSLRQAIRRLGVPTVREIALAVAVRGKAFDVPVHRVRVRELWMHSVAAAFFGREIARLREDDLEEGFVCGLLHDVGKPLVARALSDEARRHTDRPVPAAILEAAMDAYHVEVGTRMVAYWGLPAWVQGALSNHHDLRVTGAHDDLALTTNLADELGHWALREGLAEEDFPIESPVVSALDLHVHDVVALLDLRPQALAVVEAIL